MNKNRRKSNYTPISNLLQDQCQYPQTKENFNPDKENEAKLVLLDLGNQEANFSNRFPLDDFQCQNDNFLSRAIPLSDKKHFKSASKYTFRQIPIILSQIDNNTNFSLNNFFETKKAITPNKNQRFSMRNIKSKENLSHTNLNSPQETKRQQRTILKLKSILKKLESPQKTKNSSQHRQIEVIKTIIKKKKQNKMLDNSSQFLRIPSKQANKSEPPKQFSSSSRMLTRRKQHNSSDVQARAETRTSHDKRSCSGKKMITSTPNEMQVKFFQKPIKLRNQNVMCQRNSVNSYELTKKTCHGQLFKKSSRQITSHQSNDLNVNKHSFQDIFIQQERLRDERKSRNLKNILFD